MTNTMKIVNLALFALISVTTALQNRANASTHNHHSGEHQRVSMYVPGFAANNPEQVILASSDMDYLPNNVTYNQNIPKPESILGYPVGTWHVRHESVIGVYEGVSRNLRTGNIICDGAYP